MSDTRICLNHQYRVISTLAEGSEATLYNLVLDDNEAIQSRMARYTDKPLVLKLFHKNSLAATSLLTLTTLPDTLKQYWLYPIDQGTLNDRIAIVMPKLDSDLTAYHFGFGKHQAMQQLCSQLLPAVAQLHQHGYVHQDIKPQNIMVSHQEPAFFLSDFSTLKAAKKTGTTIKGSPHWRAPEQERGQNAHYNTVKADVYSTALVLYFAITAKIPNSHLETGANYGGLSPQEIKALTNTHAAQLFNPNNTREHDAKVDAICQALCALLNPDPTQRPDNFTALGLALGIELTPTQTAAKHTMTDTAEGIRTAVNNETSSTPSRDTQHHTTPHPSEPAKTIHALPWRKRPLKTASNAIAVLAGISMTAALLLPFMPHATPTVPSIQTNPAPLTPHISELSTNKGAVMKTSLRHSQTEVSNGEYRAFALATGRRTPQGADALPVGSITINDMHAYAAWLSKKTGKHYRLPTVQEAIALRQSVLTATGNSHFSLQVNGHPAVNLSGQLHSFKRLSQHQDNYAQKAPVRSLHAWAGYYHLNGNMLEATASCYQPSNPNAEISAKQGGCDTAAVGGSWASGEEAQQADYQQGIPEGVFLPNLGFRLVEVLAE